jgi:hypothetical protein
MVFSMRAMITKGDLHPISGHQDDDTILFSARRPQKNANPQALSQEHRDHKGAILPRMAQMNAD